jgi:hypothetical protein
MMTDSIILNPEEIEKYRAELADNAKSLEDIALIEQCNGDLEYAAIRLARRSNIDTVRADADEDDFWQKITKQARQLVCHEQVKDDLAPDILGGLIGLFLTSGNAVLGVIATPLAIYIVKKTVEGFCD